MVVRDGRTLRAVCNHCGFSYHKVYKYILTGYLPTFAEIVNGRTIQGYRGDVFRLEYMNLCGRYYPFIVKHDRPVTAERGKK